MINEIKPNPTLFFTSDHHFGHANVIRFDNESFGKVARPYADVYEMNEDMISKWNSVVSENDIVFHLGDIFWRTMNVKDARNIWDRLNGKIHMIWGNHDEIAKQLNGTWESSSDLLEINTAKFTPHLGSLNRNIVLCHYAMKVWHASHRGAWHLYGHSHGSLPDDKNSLSLDVGCMLYDFKPQSFEQISHMMAEKKFVPVDHHGDR